MANNSEPVTVYVSATGEILWPTYREGGVNPTLIAGQALIDGHYDGDDFYVPGGVPTERPTILDIDEDAGEIVIDRQIGVNQTVIASMPSGTIVSTEDDFYAVAAGAQALQVRADRGGEFVFEVIPPFPYKSLVFTLVVTDAG